MIHLRFDKGSLLIRGEVGTPYGRWDPRVGAFRAMSLHYPEVLEYLDRSRLLYRDEVAYPIPIQPLETDVELRPYQREALEAWMDAGKRGVIELPTGAGKTYLAGAKLYMERARDSEMRPIHPHHSQICSKNEGYFLLTSATLNLGFFHGLRPCTLFILF